MDRGLASVLKSSQLPRPGAKNSHATVRLGREDRCHIEAATHRGLRRPFLCEADKLFVNVPIIRTVAFHF